MWDFLFNLSRFLQQVGLATADLLLLSLCLGVWISASLFFLKYLGIFILVSLERRFHNGQFELWLNIMQRIKAPIVIVSGIFFSCLLLPLPPKLFLLLAMIYFVWMLVFVIVGCQLVIVNAVKVYLRSQGASGEAIITVTNFVKVVSGIVMWLVAILIILQVSKVDTQALIGGLGIASIIVAFSFQNILKDVFAFFSIYVDRSFAVGDYIIFNGYEGVIKAIRMRTTKIQALKGNELIISNQQLVNGVIQNYRSVKKRRVAINFYLYPNLSAQQSQQVIAGLKKIFAGEQLNERVVLRSACLASLSQLGAEFQIIYSFIYHSGEQNYYQHLATREQILQQVLQLLEKLNLRLTSVTDCQSFSRHGVSAKVKK